MCAAIKKQSAIPAGRRFSDGGRLGHTARGRRQGGRPTSSHQQRRSETGAARWRGPRRRPRAGAASASVVLMVAGGTSLLGVSGLGQAVLGKLAHRQRRAATSRTAAEFGGGGGGGGGAWDRPPPPSPRVTRGTTGTRGSRGFFASRVTVRARAAHEVLHHRGSRLDPDLWVVSGVIVRAPCGHTRPSSSGG